MSGALANYIYIKDGRVTFDTDKYSGDSVINSIFMGIKSIEETCINVQSYKDSYDLQDPILSPQNFRLAHLLKWLASGAYLINFDEKFIVVGISEWNTFDGSLVEPLLTLGIDCYDTFEDPVLRAYCSELLELFWPKDWCIYWAKPDDFAISDNLKLDWTGIVILPKPTREALEIFPYTRESMLITLTKGLMTVHLIN